MKLFRHAQQLLVNFCAVTNIHGFAYVVQTPRWRIEKLFWLLTIIISVTLTCLLLQKLQLESKRNPTIIYTDQNVVHVSEILFPAITLTPGLILKTPLHTGIDYESMKVKLTNGSLDIASLTLTQLKRLQIASLIARDGFMAQFNVTIPTDDLVQRLRDDFPSVWWFRTDRWRVNLPHVPYFFYANWSEAFSANFTEVLCPSGLCYTFNMPADLSSMWRVEKLSRDFVKGRVLRVGGHIRRTAAFLKALEYPLRGPKNGKGLWMRIHRLYAYVGNGTVATYYNDRLSQIHDTGDFTTRRVKNFSMYEHSLPARDSFGTPFLIHEPHVVVSNCLTKYYTLHRYNMRVLITPRVEKYDDTLEAMNADERQCYLPNERHLCFFTIYNRINCEHECLANLSQVTCGCTQFFMVRDEKARICGVADEKCLRRLRSDFEVAKESCKCYESCERIDYDVLERFEKEYNIREHPTVRFNFAVDKVLPQSRRKQQTVVSFLSLVGGFFGLFAGFSVLSGFELLFFFTLEPFLAWLRTRDNRVRPILTQKRRLIAVRRYFDEFLANSSVHGFNHIGNGEKSMLERLIWVTFFSLAMVASYCMVVQVLGSQQLNQIMMTKEGRVTRALEIPFPAVTVTDRIHLYSYQLRYFLSRLADAHTMQTTFEEVYAEAERSNVNTSYHQMHGMLCYDAHISDIMDKYEFNFTHLDIMVDMMRWYQFNGEYWPPPQQNWTWNGSLKPPLTQVLSKRAFAPTFNIIDERDLLNFNTLSRNFHYSYENDSRVDSLPWSTSVDNANGLVVQISKIANEKSCAGNFFAIFAPNELPIDVVFNPITMEHSIDIAITPHIVKADDDLRSVAVEERKCYFEGERRLEYFKVYTRSNCETECSSRNAYKVCRCVPFFFVRNATMDICDYRHYIRCIMSVSQNDLVGTHENSFVTESDCRCYPLCNTIVYLYEPAERYNLIDDNATSQRTKLTFRYQDSEFYALLLYQPFKLVDFLSYVGGILGLFAGVSVLSIVELGYFFTVRLLSNVVRRLRRGA